MVEIVWKSDMRSFQVEYMPVNNLIIKINESIQDYIKTMCDKL